MKPAHYGVASSPVLVHRTPLRRLMMSLVRVVPDRWRALWRGPVGTVSLGEAAGRLAAWSLRPVDILVPPEMVLQQRLTIPNAARKELGSAIALFIEHKTPFSAGELLIHAREDGSEPSGEQASYTIRAVPRAVIATALKDRKVRRHRIGRIGVTGVAGVDLAPALRRGGSLSRWSFMLPVAITVGALGMLATGEVSAKRDHVAALEAEISDTLVRVRTVTAELDAHAQTEVGIGEVSRLLQTSPSAFATLMAVRELLPESTEITRVKLSGAESRFSIRSPDVLAVVQALGNDGNASWAASIDGPITANPASGGEAATVLLRDGG